MDGVSGCDVELLTKVLQVEHKLFYFDLKENPRGRYLKISEKTSSSRSTIIVPETGIVWFVDLFNYYAGRTEKLLSKELQMDAKVFYFDIGANQRGRFLKISEASSASVRSTIIVPSGSESDEGWSQFRDVLVRIHEISQRSSSLEPSQQLSFVNTMRNGSSPTSNTIANNNSSTNNTNKTNSDTTNNNSSATVTNTNDAVRVSSAKVLRAEQKRFFFDLGSNARGQYLKISEVIGNDRSAIILPTSALEQFYETIGQFVEMVKNESAGVSLNENTTE